MPITLVALPDIQQTVTRPMNLDMAKQIIEVADLPKDIVVHYAGKRGARATPGSLMHSNGHKEAEFSASNILMLSITEEYNTEAIQEIQPFSWDQRPLFIDKKLGLSLRPVYIENNVTVEIIFRHSSETEVQRWLSTMYTRASAGRQGNLHTLSYSYPFPHEFFKFLLEDVHKLREAVEPYGDTLEEYFDKHRSPRLFTISDQNGTEQVYTVREKQSNVQGFFEIPTVPEKATHLDDLGMWQGVLVYKYSFQRPEQMLIEYPISVHNQFLPEKYLVNLLSIDDPRSRPHYFSYSQEALEHFSLDRQADPILPSARYITIPEFDDFGEDNHNSETIFPEPTATIFTALVFLDETDHRTLCSLDELGDVFIDEDILAFLRTEAPYLTKLYHSVFHLSFFIDGVTRPYEEISVDANLCVKATRTLSMRSKYHIRLSLLPEINKALYSALKRATEHPAAFFKIIKGINELLAIDPTFKGWEKLGRVEPWMFDAIYHVVFGLSPGNVFGRGMDLTGYLTEHLYSSQRMYGLFKDLNLKTLMSYLGDKRLRMKTVMDGFCVARHIEEMN